MRAVDPSLNHGWYDESYLRGFAYDHLGENIKIHKTVVLPSAKEVALHIGNNVVIGPYTVIQCEIFNVGDDAKIGSHCVFEGGEVVILPAAIIPTHTGIVGEALEEEVVPPPRRRRRPG